MKIDVNKFLLEPTVEYRSYLYIFLFNLTTKRHLKTEMNIHSHPLHPVSEQIRESITDEYSPSPLE